VDEYIAHLESYHAAETSDAQRLENPVWHIHGGKVPDERYPVSFALLLNLVSASNAHNRDVLWGFIHAYASEPVSPESNPGLDRLADFALRYYEDFVKPTKTFRAPDDKERAALEDLASRLEAMGEEKSGSAVQDVIYEIGKAHGFEPLRAWFGALYEVLLGQTQGPRFGSFAALFGTANTAAMIRAALKGEFLK
jgi:lysyl-tRNA synthetase class 1